MYRIYSAETCPFAQRARAVLTHLGIPFEMKAVNLEDRDPELLRLSPTGKVPLLLDGDFKLYESSVIVEYLADNEGWEQAWGADPRQRARRRLALKQWDGALLPVFFGSMRDPGGFDEEVRASAGRELDELSRTLRDTPAESLLGFCLAPFWARMDWLRELTRFPRLIDEREALRRRLDEAVAMEAVQATLPDRDLVVERYRKRFAGG